MRLSGVFTVLALLAFTLISQPVQAQYFDWGQEPASVKWNRVDSDNGPIVFPDYYQKQALRLMNYMDSVRGQVSYG
ncbi:MAG: hypothetical protein LUE10_07355, partial [Alistipes sp.]|nr:hypothetical protein [Alistipes sp.]